MAISFTFDSHVNDAPDATKIAAELAFEQFFKQRITVQKEPLEKKDLMDHHGILTLSDGRIFRSHVLARTIKWRNKNDWGMTRTLYDLNDPHLVEAMLPTFSLYFYASGPLWNTFHEVFLIDFIKTYRLIQSGVLRHRHIFGTLDGINLDTLTRHNCVLAHVKAEETE